MMMHRAAKKENDGGDGERRLALVKRKAWVGEGSAVGRRCTRDIDKARIVLVNVARTPCDAARGTLRRGESLSLEIL